MRVAIIGSGYVGLVTGACFSEFGYAVTCVDVDADKVERLKQGEIPIFEPGLESLVARGLSAKTLSFTTDFSAAIPSANVVMIAVGTPSRRGDGHADLSYVYQAAAQIAKHLSGYTVVVTKSTVPVGTCRRVKEIILEQRPDLQCGVDFDVASNPEFLREGSAIEDFMRPDRVVVGVESERCGEVMRRLYRPLFLIETPVLLTQIETSELIKYASNAFLALKISFINQMADLAEKVGGDIQDLAKGMGLDKRIGSKFLHAGPGYGGSCFPKDTLALRQTADAVGAPLSLVNAVVDYNDARKKSMATRVLAALGKRGNIKGKRVALLGVTFKPNTDDLRDAPSLDIIRGLQEEGVAVIAYDPLYFKGSDKALPVDFPSEIMWAESAYTAMTDADAVVIVTEWNAFRALDLERMATLLKRPENFKPLVIDFRNIYKPCDMKTFEYISIGRGVSND